MFFLISLISTLFCSLHGEYVDLAEPPQELRLINTKTGHVVVEFCDDAIQFHDRFLELEMEEVGILIPFSLQPEFLNKEIIYLDDPLFKKAFLEIYYPICIANSLYQWQIEK